MNREHFMAQVRELADQLGDRLYALVAKQGNAIRESALRDARDRLRAELGGEQVEVERPRRTQRADRKVRKQQRCSKCQSTEHNARRCDKEPEDEAEADEETPTPEVSVEPPPTTGGADRFARIEAQASARRDTTSAARVAGRRSA